MFRIDHHLHTSRHSPDSIIDPIKLVKHAKAIGLNGLVITEHDYQWEAKELSELNAQADGLVVLAGAEISAREGHFLVYGLPNLDEVGPGVSLAKLLTVVKRHDAAVVAAHPYRWDQDFDAIFAEHGVGLDAIELVSNNVTELTRAKAARLLEKNPQLGTTGSSDGHDIEIIGCYHTGFRQPISSMAEFVSAIKARLGKPCQLPGTPSACGPV